MYKIERLDLTRLDPELLAVYEQMTERRYRHLLQPPGSQTIAYGITFGGKPVGLALAEAKTLLNLWNKFQFAVGEWHTFFIDPAHMQAHHFQEITEELTRELGKLHCKLIGFTFNAAYPIAPAFEKVLKTQGWEGPDLFMLRYHFVGDDFKPSWLKRAKRKPYLAGYDPFPWKELTSEEREELKNLQENIAFPETVLPFNEYEDPVDPLNSLGLRFEGKVVGWMLTHRIKPDTIRYSSLYIFPEHQSRGMAIKLLADSITLQQQAHVTFALLELNVERERVELSWFQFVEKRIAPFAFLKEKIVKYKRAIH